MFVAVPLEGVPSGPPEISSAAAVALLKLHFIAWAVESA
jgi:hypothetical protein